MTQDLNIQWNKCLEIFRDNLKTEQFEAWFKPIVPLEYKDNTLVLKVPSPFFIEQLEERFFNILSLTLKRIFGSGIQLFYRFEQVSNEPSTSVTYGSSKPSPAVAPRPGADIKPVSAAGSSRH